MNIFKVVTLCGKRGSTFAEVSCELYTLLAKLHGGESVARSAQLRWSLDGVLRERAVIHVTRVTVGVLPVHLLRAVALEGIGRVAALPLLKGLVHSAVMGRRSRTGREGTWPKRC